MEETALIVASELNPAVIFSNGGMKEVLKTIEQKALAHVPDVATDQGRKDIASLAYKVARSKTLLDDMGKDLVSDWKKKAKVVDDQRKEARDFLDSLKDRVRQPLTAWEAEEEKRKAELAEAEEKRVKGIMAKTDGIKAFFPGNLRLSAPSPEVAAVIKALEATPVNEEIFNEFLGIAIQAKAETLAGLYDFLAQQNKREEEEAARKAEAERLEAQRKAQEAEAARLAEERRKIEEAQRIERERIEAEQEAERKRIEAERLAHEEATRKIREEQEAAQRKLDEERASFEAQKKAEADRIEREAREKREAEEAKAKEEAEEIETVKQTRFEMLSAVGFVYPFDDLGTMPDHQWTPLYSEHKSAWDKKQNDELLVKLAAERDAKEKAEAERKAREAALKPDKEKLIAYADALGAVAVPDVTDETGAILFRFLADMADLVENFKREIGNL